MSDEAKIDLLLPLINLLNFYHQEYILEELSYFLLPSYSAGLSDNLRSWRNQWIALDFFIDAFKLVAEREGFEPSIGVKAYTPLAGERLQPLGHLSEEGILYWKYFNEYFSNSVS